MPRGKPELRGEAIVVITEHGDTDYRLKVSLFKARLVIDDMEGNRIAVDKRQGRMVITGKGNVEWRKEAATPSQ